MDTRKYKKGPGTYVIKLSEEKYIGKGNMNRARALEKEVQLIFA
ncbi:hypothetical protein [Peribacillus simplex]|nr:hypothetical protein [Peribacillus simplex]